MTNPYIAHETDPQYLREAFSDLGLQEITGPKHEARVLQMFKDAGHPEIHDDETAWCAAAVGAWLKRGGKKNTGSLMARSYTYYGVPTSKTNVPRGAICVWPRGTNPASGHVNIAVYCTGPYVYCIGGNQYKEMTSGAVTISRFKLSSLVAARLPE